MKWKRATAILVTLVLLTCAAMPAFSLAAEEPLVYDNNGFPVTGHTFLTQMGYGPGQSEVGTLYSGSDPVDPGTFAATGQTVRIADIDGNLSGERDVVIVGDVTGTGCAGIAQITRMARAVAGSEPLTGIWAMAGDINGSGTVDINDLVLAAQQAQQVSSSGGHVLEEAAVPVHASSYYTKPVPRELMLTFMDGRTDIPYIRDDIAFSFLRDLFPLQVTGAELSVVPSPAPGVVTWQRENGSMAEINFESSIVWFDDCTSFYRFAGSPTIMGLLDASANLDEYLFPTGSFDLMGRAISMDLQPYDIELLYQNGHGYFPFQTFIDVFCTQLYANVLYNGEACFVVPYGELGELADLYYAAAPRARSEELGEYSYNELCFLLDNYYGLKELHDIKDMNTFLRQAGLYESLSGTDPVAADQAIYTLTRGYLGDLHSSFGAVSSYAGADADYRTQDVSPSYRDYVTAMTAMLGARAENYPEGVPAYQEVGDTAYVTFDQFIYDDVEYTAQTLPTADSPELSTNGLIRYAHSQITREDSPIQNVVMDLSCNTGGDANAAVFAISWFLGTGTTSMYNTMTGAQATVRYQIDLNGDGVYTPEADSVSGLRRYCMIGRPSFSCGNFVPSCFKNSPVTLVGQQSAGGACVVLPVTLADGTLFNISGPTRISTLTNGAYYDVDRGVTPDVMINNVEHFYMREYLNSYLEGLLR